MTIFFKVIVSEYFRTVALLVGKMLSVETVSVTDDELDILCTFVLCYFVLLFLCWLL